MRPRLPAVPARRGRWIAAGAGIVVLAAAALVGTNVVSSRAEAASARVQAQTALAMQRDAWKNFTTERDRVDGQQVRLDRPVGVPMRALAIFVRGQGGDVDSDMGANAWLGSLRSQGWAIATSELHGDSWGSAAAVDDLDSLASWAKDRTGMPVRLVVAGSMGSTVAVNALAQGFTTDCLYDLMPVVDLTTVDKVPKAEDQIHALYPGTMLNANNPINQLSHLPTIKYHVRSSPQDTFVPAIDNADVMIRWLELTGRSITVSQASGQHGSPSHFSANDLDGFARGCLPQG